MTSSSSIEPLLSDHITACRSFVWIIACVTRYRRWAGRLGFSSSRPVRGRFTEGGVLEAGIVVLGSWVPAETGPRILELEEEPLTSRACVAANWMPSERVHHSLLDEILRDLMMMEMSHADYTRQEELTRTRSSPMESKKLIYYQRIGCCPAIVLQQSSMAQNATLLRLGFDQTLKLRKWCGFLYEVQSIIAVGFRRKVAIRW